MPNKTIAIIGAMDCEIEKIKELISNIEIVDYHELKIYTGLIGDNKVVLAKSGVGKVNASLNTQYIIDKYYPDYVINTGVAGGIKKGLSVGDIVIGETLVQYDFDVTALGYAKGYMCTGVNPDKPTVFYSDNELIAKFEQSMNGKEIPLHKGIIATGDMFISSAEKKKEIAEIFNAIAVEMEACAIAQVSNKNGVPCIIVRAISDLAEDCEHDSQNDAEAMMAQIASTAISDFLKQIA